MSAWGLLRMLVCRPTRRQDPGKLINEAEKTRIELAQLTQRLTAHVIALQTLTRRYTHEHKPEGEL